ncbi:unnamed protein product [Rotaria magnacalcarata]|uniref:Transposase n=1 Tax=Rotaria magnacalcarata TaxID=392030 RepID=A0A8S2P2G4_9BILA|nr:unnamed protein product [Rotaria magnacalcarata]
MKSKDIQKVVKTKYGNGDGPMKIYRDLAGVVSLKTIKLWIKMINNTGSINLSPPPDRPHGIYNAQNDRVWAMSREEADKKGAIHEKTKFPVKVMVWLGVCAESLTVPVIFEDATMDAQKYIKVVLPIASKSGKKMLGKNWTYQQDGATPHTHHHSQKWCADHFPAFIPKIRWPSNSPDLCSFDYSLWNELGQVMDWNYVTAKATLIEQIKKFVKKLKKKKLKILYLIWRKFCTLNEVSHFVQNFMRYLLIEKVF